jgi:Mn2+/Fe2+ NRAMP family transporter
MTKEDGIRIREARRARVRRIRARVIGGSVALFLAVWMLITVVLVTGHDPALARKTQTQAATAATTATTTSSSTGAAAGSTSATASTSSGATSSSTGSSAGSSSSGLSPVTSSQS